jgi:putative selenium metabolism hydrolase
MEIEMSTTGRSCHGSAPERGENAIYKMAPVIQDIERLHTRLPDRAPLGRGSVTISQVKSRSPSLCAVADGCTIHLDRRLTAGETAEIAVQELLELPSAMAQHAEVTVCRYDTPSYTGLVYPTDKIYPSWLQPLDSAQVRAAVSAYEDVFEQKAPLGYWVFSTNGVATAGLLGIPSIGFGPGYEEQAHAPDEYVPVDHLAKAAAFYMGMINAFCEQRGLGL